MFLSLFVFVNEQILTNVLMQAMTVMIMQHASTQMGVLLVHAMPDTVVTGSIVTVIIQNVKGPFCDPGMFIKEF